MKSAAAPRSRGRTAAAILLAALIPCLILWRGALLRGVFFQADLVVYYYPAYTYATRVLRSGVLPLWAPEMEGGQPFLAQWEPTVLYPVDVPFRFLLPPWWALNLALVFHFALAAVGMFVYGRFLAFSRTAALVSAALFAINGFMIAHLEHPNLIVGAAWLPWLLLAAERGLRGRPLAGALGIGAGLGLMLLGGHPDLFLMATLLLGLLALLHPTGGALRGRRWRNALPPLSMLAGGYVLGIGLAAAQVLPTLELARLSWQRRGASMGYQDTWSLKPLQFLVQLLPDVFGRNGQDTYWGVAHYWEECSYVGALALVLAAAGLLSRYRMARFYAGVALLSVWLAMGTNGLAFALLRQVPPFGTMRLPCRYMLLFDLSIAVLAGAGTHWLSRLQRPVEWRQALWLRGVVGAALGFTALWLLAWWLGRDHLLAEVAASLAAKHRFHTPDVTPLLRRYAAQLGLDAALLLGGLALAATLLLLATRRPALRRLIPSIALAGVVATLFLFGSGYHTVIPARLVAEPPFTVRAIRAAAPEGPFRLLAWDSIRLHANVAVHRGWWPTDERGYRQYIAALPGNYNLVWGLAGVRQEEWSALPLRYTSRFTSAILAKGERDGIGAVAPFFPWWNAGYVISQRPLRDPSLTLITADRIHLYRTQDPGHRAWIVHEATVEPQDGRLLERLMADPAGLMKRVALAPDAGLSGELSARKRESGENAKLRRDMKRENVHPPRWYPGSESAKAERAEWRKSVAAGRKAAHSPLSSPFALSPFSRFRAKKEAASVVARSPTWVEVEAVAAQEGYLVLGETWAPGWRAWLDGRPTSIRRANIVHRAVSVPAGRHRVTFRYEPTSLRLGLFLSLGALAVLLFLATAGIGGRP